MIIQAINTTAGTLTYSNVPLTVGPGATVTVPTPLIPAFVLDPNVNSDIVANNLQISNGVTTYPGDAALQFLQKSLAVLILINTIPASATITAQDTGSSSTSVFNGQTFITGTPTANSFVSVPLVNSGTLTVLVTGTWTGTLIPEITLDGGTTWVAVIGQQTGIVNLISSFTGNAVFTVTVVGNTQFRVRSTAAWTGTATINATLSDAVAGMQIEPKNKFTHIHGAATTTVKSGAGKLDSLIINAQTGQIITIYDNTAASGTVIAIVVGGTKSDLTTCTPYNIEFSTGLTVVTTTGTSDITVTYQ